MEHNETVVATLNAQKPANVRKTLGEERLEILRELLNLQEIPTVEDEDDDSNELSKFNFTL